LAEAEAADEEHVLLAVLAGLVDQVGAGDAHVDAAEDQFAGDLGRRVEAHRDLRQVLDRADIAARAAGTGDGPAGAGEGLAGQFLEPALGRHGEGQATRNIVHSPASRSSRSTHSAQPEAFTGSGAPSRSSMRSYSPPEARMAPSEPVISKTMPV